MAASVPLRTQAEMISHLSDHPWANVHKDLQNLKIPVLLVVAMVPLLQMVLVV
jgi:hypothetical protein